MIFARFFHQSPALCLIPGGDKCMKSHAWEQRKLGTIVQITMGQSPDGSTYSDTPADYILVQGNADLKNGWVCPRVWTTQKTKFATAGDLIMSVRAPAGSVGKTAYDVVLGRGVASLKGNEFIYQSLVKMDFDGYWKAESTGSTFESLSSDSISTAELYCPSEDEQHKIGIFLSRLDSLLTLHQRKWVEFFYPTYFRKFSFLNFWEFFNNRITNAWEQRKIKDLAANTYGGGTPSTSNPDFWEGSIPWIQSSDLSEHNLFRVRPRKFISQAAVTNSPVKIIPESSIAVITRVGVGKLAVMNFSYTTSQDFLSLSNLNTDVKFTSYQLYRRLQKDLNAVQGTSIKGITKEELLGKNIFIPGRQEQEAIGKFFSKIDSLLTLHQRQSVSSDLLGASLHL